MRPAYLQRGLSLIELMVAMLLSMLLLLGATQMFITSKQSYSNNTDLARIQENARFAMEFIGYDLRNAGFKGDCRTDAIITSPYSSNSDITDINTPLVVPAAGSANGDHQLTIKHAATVLATATSSDISGSSITIESKVIPESYDYTLISSIDACELVERGSKSSSATTTLALNTSLQNTYPADITQILGYTVNTYKVVNRALNVVTNKDPSQGGDELVQGIEAIRFTYAEGTGSGQNRRINDNGYRTANLISNWNNVVAVRVQIVAIGGQDNVVPEDQYYSTDFERICGEANKSECGANPVRIDGRRLAKLFSSTFSLRNQLP